MNVYVILYVCIHVLQNFLAAFVSSAVLFRPLVPLIFRLTFPLIPLI